MAEKVKVLVPEEDVAKRIKAQKSRFPFFFFFFSCVLDH